MLTKGSELNTCTSTYSLNKFITKDGVVRLGALQYINNDGTEGIITGEGITYLVKESDPYPKVVKKVNDIPDGFKRI